MNRNRVKYINHYGAKTTVVSELFKESELQGKSIIETQAELISNGVVKPRMLSEYTKTYQRSKDYIDWINR